MLSFKKQFEIYVFSGFPLMVLDTVEIDRATEELLNFVSEINLSLKETTAPDDLIMSGYRVYIWDIVNGWGEANSTPTNTSYGSGTKDPISALNYVLSSQKAGVYIMHNFHLAGYNADKIQLFIEVYRKCKKSSKHLILVGSSELPEEIRHYFVTLDFKLPTEKELTEQIQHFADKAGIKLKKINIEEAADAVLGMTSVETENSICVSAVVEKGKKLNIPLLYEEKAKAVKKAGLLEFIPTTEDISFLGGLDAFKNELKTIEYVFKNRKKAEEYKLAMPKGCLIVGAQGSGKSLAVKVTANILGAPLFLCKLRNLRGGIVGDSERNTKELLKLFDSLYRCVIWFDELEKDLAGYKSSGETEAGVMSGIVGSLLTYMQEKKNMVYFFATCNDILALPPEFLRKGRFDEVWYTDLPVIEERIEIFNIHVNKVGREPKKYDVKKLAAETVGFSGAEIESVIYAAMRKAFMEDREFNTKDILTSIKETVSLSMTKKEEIIALRNWAKDRARWASSVALIGKKQSASKSEAFWEKK